jgi:hypothetical protein
LLSDSNFEFVSLTARDPTSIQSSQPTANLKPLYAVVDGKAEHHSKGTYFLRYAKNGRRAFCARALKASEIPTTDGLTKFPMGSKIIVT